MEPKHAFNRAIKRYASSSAHTSKAMLAASTPKQKETAGTFKRRRKFLTSALQSNDVYFITPYRHQHQSSTASSLTSFESSPGQEEPNTANLTMMEKVKLTSWGFPEKIVDFYRRKGIHEFFEWQVQCLDLPGVLDGRNLVYSAPTSAGKTMVSDVLLFKTLLERKKKAIIILPFVSIAVEKVNSMKQLLRRMGIRIDSFAGNSNPRGGFDQVDVAVCTIEKANNMINRFAVAGCLIVYVHFSNPSHICRLTEENKLSEVGIVIVDELHMIGDANRGYLLELLLSKLLYINRKDREAGGDTVLQIVGMSATIPNLADIAQWIDGELFITDFRPVPLYQRIVYNGEVRQVDEVVLQQQQQQQQQPVTEETALVLHSKLALAELAIKQDDAPLIYSAIETLVEGYSALVFCSTKALCERTSRSIAENIYEFGAGKKAARGERVAAIGRKLTETLDGKRILAVIQSLKRTAMGIDRNLESVIRFGVAFHHAGLSTEERAIIEKAFRDGTIRILCSTTTLSAGVNLPARRVLISTPLDFKGAMLDTTCYRQMVGRAGRKGIDNLGESMLFCRTAAEYQRALKWLVFADLSPVKSCLLAVSQQSSQPETTTTTATTTKTGETGTSTSATVTASPEQPTIKVSDNFKRAILEVISNGTATNYADIVLYVKSTFFQANYGSIIDQQTEQPEQQPLAEGSPGSSLLNSVLDQVFNYLISYKLIYISNGNDFRDNSKLMISPLGKAIVASGVSPEDGQFIMRELDKARRSMCLVNDLHLIYQVTPVYLADQLDNISWENYMNNIFLKLDDDCRTIANMIGVCENYLWTKLSYNSAAPTRGTASYEKLLVYKRFYISLALFDLVQEVPLPQVAAKYRLTKGVVQSLQQQAASFAGMLSTFCGKLGWNNFELLIEQFQPRLSFGVQRELIDLMRITFLTSTIARQLFKKGYETLTQLIYKKESDIEEALISTSIFENNGPSSGAGTADPNRADVEVVDPALTQLFIPNLEQYVTIRQLASLIRQEARILVEADVGQKLNFDLDDIESSDNELESKPENPKKEEETPKEKPKKRPSEISLGDIDFDEDIEISSKSVDKLENAKAEKKPEKEPEVKPKSLSADNTFDDIDFDDNLTEELEKIVASKLNANSTAHSLAGGSPSTFTADAAAAIINQSMQSIDLELDNDADDEFFNSFRQSRLQQGELPAAFEVANTTKVTPEKFTTVLVRSERHCKQMLAEIFATHVLMEADSVLNIALHFTLEPIVNPFFTKLKMKSAPIKGRQPAEERVFRIEDRYPVQLRELYITRLGHHRIFYVNSEEMFECLQLQLVPWLKGLDPLFDLEMLSASSSPTTVNNLSAAELEGSEKKPRFRFITYDIKKAFYILQFGFHFPISSLQHRIDWHDVSVALWLLDPEAKPFNIQQFALQDIMQLALDYQLSEIDYLQKVQNLAKLSKARQEHSKGQIILQSENLYKTALLFYLIGQFSNRLVASNLYLSYKLIELPCRTCLYIMEIQGVQINDQQLAVEQSRLARFREHLERLIFEQVGSEFDLNSPEKVARVLYQEQNLLSNLFDVKQSSKSVIKVSGPPAGRRLPKTLSTSKLALIKLQAACGTTTNLPTLIMEWRRVNHALNQTILPINNALQMPSVEDLKRGISSETKFIFSQCDEWSVTGRISMHDPNLINVDKNFELSTITEAMAKSLEWSFDRSSPENSSLGLLSPSTLANSKPVVVQLRQNICARKGYVLVTADYSQLELRILAHFTKDPCLMTTLNNPDNDVFKSIAAAWKSIPVDQVTNEMRQQAKQVSGCLGCFVLGKKTDFF